MAIADALLAKLREAKDRYDELTLELSSEAVVTDGKKVAGILRKRGALEQRVRLHARLESLDKRRTDARALLAYPEMAALA